MKSMLTIPSEEDWGDYKSDLDQKYAHEIFFGKSLEETIPDFERNVIERVDELRFMPTIPFRYYLLALRNYVTSKSALANDMAPDAASSFLNLIAEKLRDSFDSIAPVMDEIMPAVEYVASNQEAYDADVDIYGDFAAKLAEIRGLYARKSGHGLSSSS
jgi:hypothetical protein